MSNIAEINEKLDMIRAAISAAQSPASRVDLFNQYRALLRQKADLLNNQRAPMQQRVEQAKAGSSELTRPVHRPSFAFRVFRWMAGL